MFITYCNNLFYRHRTDFFRSDFNTFLLAKKMSYWNKDVLLRKCVCVQWWDWLGDFSSACLSRDLLNGSLACLVCKHHLVAAVPDGWQLDHFDQVWSFCCRYHFITHIRVDQNIRTDWWARMYWKVTSKSLRFPHSDMFVSVRQVSPKLYLFVLKGHVFLFASIPSLTY